MPLPAALPVAAALDPVALLKLEGQVLVRKVLEAKAAQGLYLGFHLRNQVPWQDDIPKMHRVRASGRREDDRAQNQESTWTEGAMGR